MEFSYVYSRLVKDKTNLAQVTAYSLYKSDKISYLEGIKKSQRRNPTEEDVRNYNNTITEERINLYLSQGEVVVNTYNQGIAEQVSKKAKDVSLEEISKKLKEVTVKGVIYNLITGAVGSLLAGIIAWAIYCAKGGHFI